MYSELITDKNTWDKFVTSSYPTSFFQSWNWGEFQESLGYKVLRIGFFDEDKALVGAALGIVIKAKRGKYLYIRNGPVFGWKTKGDSEFIINELKKYAKKEGLWHIRISPHVNKDSEEAKIIKSFNYPISPMYDVDALDTWILNLEQTPEEILTNMRKTTRYEINKAKKLNVEIVKTSGPELIDEFYEIYTDTVKRQKWTGYSKSYIQKQFQTFAKDNQALMYLAKYEGKYVAASIFIYYGDSSFYHYSGTLTEFRKIPAAYLIQWENILEAQKRGLKRYNFWGISPENKTNHPWHGLTFFKLGFGGFEERWLETRDIPVSPKYYLTYGFEIFDKWKKGY